MKSIAIITAHGGCKRIPKKNIKDFCGKPIIAYSIEAAAQSGNMNLDGAVSEHSVPIFVSGLQVQDIDSEDDWKIAELKYQLINGKRA